MAPSGGNFYLNLSPFRGKANSKEQNLNILLSNNKNMETVQLQPELEKLKSALQGNEDESKIPRCLILGIKNSGKTALWSSYVEEVRICDNFDNCYFHGRPQVGNAFAFVRLSPTRKGDEIYVKFQLREMPGVRPNDLSYKDTYIKALGNGKPRKWIRNIKAIILCHPIEYLSSINEGLWSEEFKKAKDEETKKELEKSGRLIGERCTLPEGLDKSLYATFNFIDHLNENKYIGNIPKVFLTLTKVDRLYDPEDDTKENIKKARQLVREDVNNFFDTHKEFDRLKNTIYMEDSQYKIFFTTCNYRGNYTFLEIYNLFRHVGNEIVGLSQTDIPSLIADGIIQAAKKLPEDVGKRIIKETNMWNSCQEIYVEDLKTILDNEYPEYVQQLKPYYSFINLIINNSIANNRNLNPDERSKLEHHRLYYESLEKYIKEIEL
jgi:hypothetical protein